MILVHRRWIEHERLVYPLMYLPLEMVREESPQTLLPPLLRNRLFWIGVLVALLPVVMIGLRHYYPVVPELKLRNQVTIIMQREKLILRLWINFSMVAFAYLINADLGFSLWFFALVSASRDLLLRLAGVGVGRPGDLLLELAGGFEPGDGRDGLPGRIIAVVGAGLAAPSARWSGRAGGPRSADSAPRCARPRSGWWG